MSTRIRESDKAYMCCYKLASYFSRNYAPPNLALETRAFLNQQLPRRWIDPAAAKDECLLPWPPRSPDSTPLDFFLWCFVKDLIKLLPFLQTLEDIKKRYMRCNWKHKRLSIALLVKVLLCFRARLSLNKNKMNSY